MPSVAGWSSIDPVVIVFDLGEARVIESVGLHSVLSPWGPWWPAEVAVLLSDDGLDFHLAGSPTTPSPEQLSPPLTPDAVQAGIDRIMADRGLAPTTHWWRTEPMAERGRYVSLIMAPHPSTGTIVLDEIEILSAEADLPAPAAPARTFSEGKGGWRSYLLSRAIDERIALDITGLAEKANALGAPGAFHASLRTLREQSESSPVPQVGDFRAILPLNGLHRGVFRLQADLWRSDGGPEVRVWQSHRWDPLGPLTDPRVEEPRVRIVMAQNAVRSDVLNISNTGHADASARLTLRGLPEDNIDVFEVLTVDTKATVPVTAAMLPAAESEGAYVVDVPAGMTRQIWLRCSSKDLLARTYTGKIRLERAGVRTDIPASIEVVPVRLPDRSSLSVGGWDYAIDNSYGVTAENRDEFVSVLREYGVNVPWASSSVMPHGNYADDGGLAEPPSRETMDRWLEMWPDARQYCVFADSGQLAPDTPSREAKLESWARDWAAYLDAKGIAPERLAILLRDEPTNEGDLRVILETGRAIKRGAPGVRIWNDIHFADPGKAPAVLAEVMREACDIQCINRRHYQLDPEANDAFIAQHAREGLEWWTYTAGANTRVADPYVCWVLQAWFCFDKGMTGSHYWAFGDDGDGSSWNEYLAPRSGHSPLYLTPDSVVTSKYMEALREGLQDYELLLMLRRALGERGGDTQGRLTLDERVQQVLAVDDEARWEWSARKDRAVADRVRESVLEDLRALGAGGEGPR